MTAQRTYWHLEPLRRKPSEYEIVTSRLLVHPERGFEIPVPAESWNRRYVKGSPLVCDDWECFADPRQTTYAKYVRLQHTQEIFIDGILASAEATLAFALLRS